MPVHASRKRPTLGDVGEAALLKSIYKRLRIHQPRHISLGVGDDAAVLRMPSDAQWVVSSDSLVEGVHFRQRYFSPREVGIKAAEVNLSDLAAMGAKPCGLLAAISAPASLPAVAVWGMVCGVHGSGSRYQAPLIGGDITGSPGPVMINVTALGYLAAGTRPLSRYSAQLGDVLLVSGQLGGAGMVLECWERLGAAPEELAKYKLPQAKVALGMWLQQQRGVTACTDLSDGLCQDVWNVVDKRRYGVRLDGRILPLPEQQVAGLRYPKLWYGLYGGEDYELLLSCQPKYVGRLLKAAMVALQLRLFVVGEVTAKPHTQQLVHMESLQGCCLRGFRHFD